VTTFTIPGEPMGKQRPKFARAGQYTMTYTPTKTMNYETLVKEMYVISKGQYYENQQLKINVKAYFSIPKSKSKKVQEAMKNGWIRPVKTPDCDNILKIICDALNGIAYQDDKQIIEANISKWYSDKPRVEVSLTEVYCETKEVA